jgi:hypothetical protein
MNSVRFLILLLVMSLASGAAFAQTPALDSDAAPHVDLSAAQKQTVYQSISNLQKNNAAPPGFRATIGAIVPDGVQLEPVPATPLSELNSGLAVGDRYRARSLKVSSSLT